MPKYKIGDKVKFMDGFDEVEYTIISKKGADAMNQHQPKSYSDMTKFSQPIKKSHSMDWEF